MQPQGVHPGSDCAAAAVPCNPPHAATPTAVLPPPPAANHPQATFLLLFINTCGFVISKGQIPGGWNAVYWSNPMQVRKVKTERGHLAAATTDGGGLRGWGTGVWWWRGRQGKGCCPPRPPVSPVSPQ